MCHPIPTARRRPLPPAVVLALAITAASVTPWASAHAQSSSVPSLIRNPSARAAGMGGAAGAVFWGDATSDWANPALLSYREDFQYERQRVKLVSELADDVAFTANRLFFQISGVGLTASFDPVRTRLDYGTSSVVDDGGTVLGEFDSHEDIQWFGVSLSVARVLDTVLADRLDEDTVSPSRLGDVAFGYADKELSVDLAPAWATPDGTAGKGEGDIEDVGVLARINPLAVLEVLVPAYHDAVHQRVGFVDLDVAVGRSRQNGENKFVEFRSGETSPIPQLDRTSTAWRVAVGLPTSIDESLRSRRLGWLADAMVPAIQFGRVDGTTEVRTPQADDPEIRDQDIDGDGWELTLLNVFSIRRGHVDDGGLAIEGDTEGWGVRLPLGPYGHVQYDSATLPPPGDLTEDLEPAGFAVRLDVARIYDEIWD